MVVCVYSLSSVCSGCQYVGIYFRYKVHLGPEGSVPYIRLFLTSEVSLGIVVYEIAVIIPSFWMDIHHKIKSE